MTGKWLSFPLILTFKVHEPRCSFEHNEDLWPVTVNPGLRPLAVWTSGLES